MGTIKKLQIGNVTLENNLILAPMAGVTDLPFRLLCKEQGAGLLCMEMVSAKAILYKNKNTEELLTIDPREHPVSLQLFGSDPDIISEIAKQIEAGTGVYFPEYCQLVLETINFDSYYLTTKGIVIYFQQYDIAPYSSGLPEFVIKI